MNQYSKSISIMLIVFIMVSFVGLDYAQAQSISDTSFNSNEPQLTNKVGVGALVVLGVWGIYKLVKEHRKQAYQTYLRRGKVYLEEGNYRLAIKNLEQATDIKDTLEATRLLYQGKSEYKKYHYQLGSSYLQEGNWELAYHQFGKVKKYDNNYLDIKAKYNKAYQELRKLKLKRVAILDFEDTTYRYSLASRATSLFSAQLLDKNPKFIEVVERDKLNAILKEQKLGASGLIDSSTAKDLGNILGVDYLVVGKVLSGSVSEDRSSEYVEIWNSEEQKLQYTIQKEAYTHIIFKLLNVSNGSIVLSKKVKKKERYKESYYRGSSIIIPSDEEMIDEALTKAVNVFAQAIYDKYEL